MPTVFSANHSAVLLDGDPVEGLQSIAFRVVTEREDVRAVGSGERIDVSFGLRTVQGEMVIRSDSATLDDKLDKQAKFQLVANLNQGEGDDVAKRTYSFDDCYAENKSLEMGAGGSAATTYLFTATRVREE